MNTSFLHSPDARLEMVQVLTLAREKMTPQQLRVLDFVLSGDASSNNDIAEHMGLSRERARNLLDGVLAAIRRVTSEYPVHGDWSDVLRRRRAAVERALWEQKREEERQIALAQRLLAREGKIHAMMDDLLRKLSDKEIITVSTTLPEPYNTELLNRLARRVDYPTSTTRQ